MTDRQRNPLLWALVTAALAPVAQAETSPYFIGASVSVTHDSNLLRLADGQAAPPGQSKSDTITSLALLGGIDQPIGRQRIFGNLTLRDNKMSRNDIYNSQGYALIAGVDWSTIERISGNLKFTANRSLASFNTEGIGLVTKKNLQSTKQLDASARVGGVTKLTFEVTASGRDVDYSAEEYRGRIFRQNSVSAGMRYRLSGATNVGFALRDAHGRYPKFRETSPDQFQADEFNRRDIDFDVNFIPSAASSFYGRISSGKIRYDLATQRDFSGITGLIRWNWQPTGKLRFDTRLTRDPGQDSYFVAGSASDITLDFSRVTDALRMRVDYEVTAKTSLNATVGYQRRSLAVTELFLSETGSDHSTNLALGAVWMPLRSVTLGCDLAYERRKGTPPLSTNVKESTIGCYGQVTLQ